MDISTYNDVDFLQTFTADPQIDLTGLQVHMMVRRRPEDATAYLNLNSLNGGILVPLGTDGLYTIRIFQPQLATMPTGSYSFSVIAVSASSRVQIGRGTLVNNAGPTRF